MIEIIRSQIDSFLNSSNLDITIHHYIQPNDFYFRWYYEIRSPSVPDQKPLGSTPNSPQFHTKNTSVPPPSVSHQNIVISTPKNPQLNTPLSSTPKGVWNG